MSSKTTTQEPAESTEVTKGFTAEERAAMKERAAELKKEKSRGKKADGTADLLAKIEEMSGLDRLLAERIHAIVTATAPHLAPRTWYGMPAYARDGKVVCFFQAAQKFEARYATLGFNDTAKLDDGVMWPVSYALTGLTEVEEAKITELVKRATS